MDKPLNFLGSYFNKDIVLRLVAVARILSWVVVAVYLLEWLVHSLAMISQIAGGSWMGMGFMDVTQNILLMLEEPLRGAVYFIVLQGLSQGLLTFMDIEDNTRRVARGMEKK